MEVDLSAVVEVGLDAVNRMAINRRAVVVELFTAVAVVTLATYKWVVNSRRATVLEASAVAVGMLAAVKWVDNDRLANSMQLVVEESSVTSVEMLALNNNRRAVVVFSSVLVVGAFNAAKWVTIAAGRGAAVKAVALVAVVGAVVTVDVANKLTVNG